jgi:uncharacterized membrane protein YqiK
MASAAVVLTMVIMVFAIFAMMVIYAMGYRTLPPNKAMVLVGGKQNKASSPQRVISGGGRFLIPGVQSYHLLDLSADLLEFELNGINTSSGGTPITMRLKVAVIWKITSDTDSLMANALKLVERTRGENQMAVKDMMEKAIRNIAASVSVEEFESDRDLVSSKVSYFARDLMNELGLEIRSLLFLKIKPQG